MNNKYILAQICSENKYYEKNKTIGFKFLNIFNTKKDIEKFFNNEELNEIYDETYFPIQVFQTNVWNTLPKENEKKRNSKPVKIKSKFGDEDYFSLDILYNNIEANNKKTLEYFNHNKQILYNNTYISPPDDNTGIISIMKLQCDLLLYYYEQFFFTQNILEDNKKRIELKEITKSQKDKDDEFYKDFYSVYLNNLKNSNYIELLSSEENNKVLLISFCSPETPQNLKNNDDFCFKIYGLYDDNNNLLGHINKLSKKHNIHIYKIPLGVWFGVKGKLENDDIINAQSELDILLKKQIYKIDKMQKNFQNHFQNIKNKNYNEEVEITQEEIIKWDENLKLELENIFENIKKLNKSFKINFERFIKSKTENTENELSDQYELIEFQLEKIKNYEDKLNNIQRII